MTLVLADTSVWARVHQVAVARLLAAATRLDALAIISPVALELLRSARDADALHRDAERLDALRRIDVTPAMADRAREVQERLATSGYHRGPSPVDLLAAAAAEAAGAELWHCDRHFDLIAGVTGQPVRRVGT